MPLVRVTLPVEECCSNGEAAGLGYTDHSTSPLAAHFYQRRGEKREEDREEGRKKDSR